MTAQGFNITSPTPLPASDDADASVSWKDPSPSAKSRYSFKLHPQTLLRLELTAETGPGQGQYAPYDGEEAVFAIVLAFLLSRRRRTRVEVPQSVGSPTRLLCVVVAVLASVQFCEDILSQIPGLSYEVANLSYYVHDIIQGLVTCVAALAVTWPQARKGWRALTAVAVILGLLSLANYLTEGLAPFNIIVFGWLNSSKLGPELFQVAAAASLYFLSWVVPLSAVPGLMRQLPTHRIRLSRMSIAVSLAGALTAISLYLTIRNSGLSSAYYLLSPFQVLRLMTGFVIVFGIIGIVAARVRAVPMLLEARDRTLLSVAAGYAMLVAFPQSYLGVHLGLVAVLAAVVTYGVLTASASMALAERSRDVLLGLKPDRILRLQKQLADADGRLAELTEELKSLDAAAGGARQAERRQQLEREARKLRCWPEDERPSVRQRTWLPGRLRRLRGVAPAERPGVPLPKPAGPMDVALALGPAHGPGGTLRAASKSALVLAFIPACYFAWHDVSTGASVSAILLNFSLPLVITFSRELTFWLFPMLVLTVAWSSLAGRRGPARAVQVWACVAVPVAVHVAITLAIGQSGTVNTVFRCGLLLLCLLLLGLALDLSTLRRHREAATPFVLFRGYFGLNRLTATLTLGIPLITAALSILGPIETGAVGARVSPTQAQVVTITKTQTQPPPSHAGKHSR